MNTAKWTRRDMGTAYHRHPGPRAGELRLPSRVRCANCGHDPVEAYCGRCGQRRRPERLHIRPLLREAADAAFNLDSGLLHTVLGLLIRPGPMIQDYLGGRTRPYTNPAKYLLICGAVTTLVSLATGFTAASADQVAAVSPEAADEAALVAGMLHRYFNLVLVLGLPLLPVLTWVFFRPNGFTFIEHLVFNTYVYAQQSLIWIAVLPFFFVVKMPPLFGAVYLTATTAYYIWASKQFFGFGALSSIVRGTVVSILFTVLFMVGLTAAMTLILGMGA